MSVLGDPKAKNGFSEEGTQPRGAIDQADLSRLGHCPYVRIEHGLAVPPRPAASHMLHARRGQFSSDISSAFGSRWCRFGSPWWKQILCFIDDFLAKVPAQILRSSAGRPCTHRTGAKAAVQVWPWQGGRACGPAGIQPEDQDRFAVWRWHGARTRRRRDVGCRSQGRRWPSVQSRSSGLLLLPPSSE